MYGMSALECLELDIKLMCAGMAGADGETCQAFKVLNKVPECGAMKDDFIATLKSARDLPMALLKL